MLLLCELFLFRMYIQYLLLSPNHLCHSSFKIHKLLYYFSNTSETLYVWKADSYMKSNGGNNFCIPESFNTNISHQLFDYTITFVNLQHQNTNYKGSFTNRHFMKNVSSSASHKNKSIFMSFRLYVCLYGYLRKLS